MYNLYYLSSDVDDKIYIGITNNPKRRYHAHLKYTIKRSYHNGNWIRKVLNQGGEIKMNIILSNLSKEAATKLEIKIIDLLKNIASDKITNTAQGGLGFNHRGVPHSEKHKIALEKAQPHKVRIPKDELYDLYVNKRLSKKEIGYIYRCGATTIDRRLIEYNIPIRSTMNFKISHKLNKSDIINRFKSGLSMLQISNQFGIGISAIRLILQKENIDTSTNKFKKAYNLEELKELYLELLQLGLKKMKIYEEIANRYGLSRAYVSRMNLSHYS